MAAAAVDSGPASSAWRRDLRLLGVVLLVATFALVAALYALVIRLLSASEWEQIQLPTSLDAAKQLGDALQSFAVHHHAQLLLAHACCYLYLQTFAIPGTVFFNLLGGALFGITLGFPLCLLYNTLGSVLMYVLSKQLGKRIVQHFFRERLVKLRGTIDAHRDDLALYMVFMRVFPFTPNWFINMASPHLEIPVVPFALGPAIGLIPYNFLSCKAGLILKELQSKGDIIDTTTTIQLVVVAVVGAVLLPKLKQRFATKKGSETKQE